MPSDAVLYVRYYGRVYSTDALKNTTAMGGVVPAPSKSHRTLSVIGEPFSNAARFARK